MFKMIKLVSIIIIVTLYYILLLLQLIRFNYIL